MTDKDQTVISASEVKTTTLTRSEQRKKNRQENRGQKKSDSSTSGGSGASENFVARTITFFKEAKDELGRVVWPTRKETIDSTWRLLILVILAGIYLGLVDSVLSRLLSLVV